MPLDSTEIETQTEPNTCAHVAVINLFKLRGMRPPPLERLKAGFSQIAAAQAGLGRVAMGAEPTMPEIHMLLAGMPLLLVTLGFIPPAFWDRPAHVLRHFLDAGCHLLVGFNMRLPDTGEIGAHIVVVEGHDERGLLVIDSELGFMEGTTIELEPAEFTEEQIRAAQGWWDKNSHGSRRVLPFYQVLRHDNLLGLNASFVIVHPDETLRSMERSRQEENARFKESGGKANLFRGFENSARTLPRPRVT